MTHSSDIYIRYADIDVMGHVNNTVYLHYFEQARMAWFHELIGGEWDWNSDGLILARNEIDYKLPLFLHDKAVVETTVEHVGNKSMKLSYRVLKAHEDTQVLVATGASILVSFDHKTQQTQPIPESWRNAITAAG
jgi:acyl-CoA thioester hydrolase